MSPLRSRDCSIVLSHGVSSECSLSRRPYQYFVCNCVLTYQCSSTTALWLRQNHDMPWPRVGLYLYRRRIVSVLHTALERNSVCTSSPPIILDWNFKFFWGISDTPQRSFSLAQNSSSAWGQSAWPVEQDIVQFIYGMTNPFFSRSTDHHKSGRCLYTKSCLKYIYTGDVHMPVLKTNKMNTAWLTDIPKLRVRHHLISETTRCPIFVSSKFKSDSSRVVFYHECFGTKKECQNVLRTYRSLLL